MNTLKLTLVQPYLHWEDRNANLEHLRGLLKNTQQTDLILLPEMFPTGFSMAPQDHFESEVGESLKWMQKLAAEKNCAVCGSVIVKDEGSYYNRLYFVREDGQFEKYDKKHLFTLAGEHKIYTPGESHLLVHYKGWKILPFVCYDLRFPVWCRNTDEADLMLFVANWPERRSDAWKTLLKARAIENMCYVAGVNRVGKDGNGVEHTGDSALYDELGVIQSDIVPSEEEVETYILQKEKIKDSRERFSFLNDRDPFDLL